MPLPVPRVAVPLRKSPGTPAGASEALKTTVSPETLAAPLAASTVPEPVEFAQPSPVAPVFPQGQAVAEPSPAQKTVPTPSSPMETKLREADWPLLPYSSSELNQYSTLPERLPGISARKICPPELCAGTVPPPAPKAGTFAVMSPKVRPRKRVEKRTPVGRVGRQRADRVTVDLAPHREGCRGEGGAHGGGRTVDHLV